MSFTHRPLHPLGNQPLFSFAWGAKRFYIRSGSCGRKKRLCHCCSEVETDLAVVQPALSFQYMFAVRHTFVRAVTSAGCLFSLFETLYQLQTVFSV